jgi:TatD DNase family protein
MLENERHAKMLALIPIERILTETDGPFTKTGERPSKPADVAVVVHALGKLYGRPPSMLALAVRENLRALLAPNG